MSGVRTGLGRRAVVPAVVVVLGLTGAGAAWAASTPVALSASGPVTVTGTDASATFTVGDRTVRQVRYADRGTLSYAFTLTNDGSLPVTVTGVEEVGPEATLLRLRDLRGEDGSGRVRVASGDSEPVVLEVLMTDCERLSARAASLVGVVAVEVEDVTGRTRVTEVALPEELRTGSAREMHCPRATADTRPPG